MAPKPPLKAAAKAAALATNKEPASSSKTKTDSESEQKAAKPSSAGAAKALKPPPAEAAKAAPKAKAEKSKATPKAKAEDPKSKEKEKKKVNKAKDKANGKDEAAAEAPSSSAADQLDHEPFHEFLKRQHLPQKVIHRPHRFRLMTWNVKHYGAKTERSRPRDAKERAELAVNDVHADEADGADKRRKESAVGHESRWQPAGLAKDGSLDMRFGPNKPHDKYKCKDGVCHCGFIKDSRPSPPIAAPPAPALAVPDEGAGSEEEGEEGEEGKEGEEGEEGKEAPPAAFAEASPLRKDEGKVVHDDERARNLVEVIYLSRSCVVILQEISKSADLELLCRLLKERGEQTHKHEQTTSTHWSHTKVVGEHVMLYEQVMLAEALMCPVAALKVECGLYQRGETLSPAFRSATDWQGLERRYDYELQGASAARLPAFFFAHAIPATEGGRSLAVCSVHLAFGKSEVRERQMDNLSSLMPGGAYTPGRCLYTLLGDFNSNASVAEPGKDLASSNFGEHLMRDIINSTSPDHVLALEAGQETTVGGQRYDEVIVHGAALGGRHAFVYPSSIPDSQKYKALPAAERAAVGDKNVHMAFCNIFSDHLAVCVDLEFAHDPRDELDEHEEETGEEIKT